MSRDLGPPPESADQDPRLPDLLDACLRAERAAPGSSDDIVREAPPELQDELAQLITVVRALEAAEWASATPAFRAGARIRFQAAAPAASRRGVPTGLRRATPWLARVAAGVVALGLAGYGSVLASAGALPGEPLYGVKQANEFVVLGLTRDDVSRALVLLRQAGDRLDEASRLAAAGQARAAGETLQQYVATLGRAAESLGRAQPRPDPQARGEFEAELQQQVGRLDALARDAPPSLRPSIQEAQVVASRELSQIREPGGPPAVAPSPSATAATVAPVSPSPAASPSVGAPVRPPAPPSAVTPPAGPAIPVESVVPEQPAQTK